MKLMFTIAVLLFTGISSASASIVTNLMNLEIQGDYYNVTIHTSGSFNDIWDGNANGIFGDADDSSFLNREPTFWGDVDGAVAAILAVVQALGSVDTWNGTSDSIITPMRWVEADNSYVWIVYDTNPTALADFPEDEIAPVSVDLTGVDWSEYPSIGMAWTSYEKVSPVPIPAAAWLFGSGLLCLIGFSKRKKSA